MKNQALLLKKKSKVGKRLPSVDLLQAGQNEQRSREPSVGQYWRDTGLEKDTHAGVEGGICVQPRGAGTRRLEDGSSKRLTGGTIGNHSKFWRAGYVSN